MGKYQLKHENVQYLHKLLNKFNKALSMLEKDGELSEEDLSDINYLGGKVFNYIGRKFRFYTPIYSRIFQGPSSSNPSESGLSILQSEYNDAVMYLSQIDTLSCKAILLLNSLIIEGKLKRACELIRLTCAIHPQIGAVVAIELIGQVDLRSLPFERSQILSFFLESDLRDYMPNTMINSLKSALETLNRQANDNQTVSAKLLKIKRLKIDTCHPLFYLSPGPHQTIIVGGFNLNYTNGGVSIIDPINGGEPKLILKNVIVFGLAYHPLSGYLYVTALKSSKCQEPHIIVKGISNKTEQIVLLREIAGKIINPIIVKQHIDRLYVFDCLEKGIYAIDLFSMTLKNTLNLAEIQSVMPVKTNLPDLLLNNLEGLGLFRMDISTGKLIKEGQFYDNTLSAIFFNMNIKRKYVVHKNRMFNGVKMNLPGVILALSVGDIDDNIMHTTHFYAEFGMDMMMWPEGHKEKLLITSSNHLISIEFPQDSSSLSRLTYE